MMVKDNRCRHNATIQTTEEALATPLKELCDAGIQITHSCKEDLIPAEIWRTVKLDNQTHDLTDSQYIDFYVGRQKLTAINKRRRDAIQNKKHDLITEAINVANTQKPNRTRTVSYGLLKLHYETEINTVLNTDHFHPRGNQGPLPIGSIRHTSLQCTNCLREELQCCLDLARLWERAKGAVQYIGTIILFGILLGVMSSVLGKTIGARAETVAQPALFEAFDCEKGLKGYRNIRGTENCYGEGKLTMRNQTVMLLGLIKEFRFKGHRCTMERTEEFLYCGWDSTESILLPSTTSIPKEVDWEICLGLAADGRVALRGEEKILQKSGILIDTYNRVGNTHHSSHNTITCDGEKIKLNGELLTSVLVNTQDKYKVEPVDLSVDKDGKIRDMTNRRRINGCMFEAHHCRTYSDTYVWIDELNPKDKCWLQNLETAIMTEIVQTSEFFSEQLKLHLIKKEVSNGFDTCNIRIYNTNHKGLFITEDVTGVERLEPKRDKGDLALFITGRDEFLRFNIENLRNKALHDEVSGFCRTAQALNKEGLFPAKERGFFFKNRGEAAVLLHCKKVLLQHAPDGKCYKRIPVIYKKERRFIAPSTRLITPTGKETNCSFHLNQLYLDYQNRWIEIGRNDTRVLKNVKMDQDVDRKKINDEYDFDTGLISTTEIHKLVNELFHSAFLEENSRKLTFETCGLEGDICLAPNYDAGRGLHHPWSPVGAAQRTYTRITDELYNSVLGKIRNIGNYCSLIICAVIAIKITQTMMTTLLRCYRMRDVGLICKNWTTLMKSEVDSLDFIELREKLDKAVKEINKIQACLQVLTRKRSTSDQNETTFVDLSSPSKQENSPK